LWSCDEAKGNGLLGKMLAMNVDRRLCHRQWHGPNNTLSEDGDIRISIRSHLYWDHILFTVKRLMNQHLYVLYVEILNYLKKLKVFVQKGSIINRCISEQKFLMDIVNVERHAPHVPVPDPIEVYLEGVHLFYT
jgi:hypothetical protein